MKKVTSVRSQSITVGVFFSCEIGIPDVRFEASVGDVILFATHTSTSEDLQVAQSFAGDIGGVFLDIRGVRAPDVSWMYVVIDETCPTEMALFAFYRSKFPGESERLQSALFHQSFEVKSIREIDEQQRVVLQAW